MSAEASRLTAAVMEIRSTALVASARRIAEAPGVLAGIAAENAEEVAAAVRPMLNQQGFLRVEVAGPRGALLFAERPAGFARDAADAGVLTQVKETGQPSVGATREEDGSVVLRATVAAGDRRPAIGAVTVVVPIEGMLRDLALRSGADVFLVGTRGVLRSGTSARLWDELAPALREGQGRRLVHSHDQSYAVSTLPLLDDVGGRLGALVQVRNVTSAEGQRQFEYNLSIAGISVLMLVLILVTWAMIRHAFAPITTAVTALDSLSAGEIEVEVLGEDRRDEVGAIARAVRVVRDRSRDGLRQAQRENRSRRRQEHFIRQQMIQIGGTLDETARQQLTAELKLEEPRGNTAPVAGQDGGSDLGVLATAFQVMTQRVVDQSAKMDGLVAELREALQAKTELIGLQQQFEIAHRMQAEMLPSALPPRSDVVVRGGILPAREFGGDFYDFFPITQSRIGVIAGHVAGHGLSSVFLTLTTRNLLKGGLFCDLGPGAALSLANRLLAAENSEGLAVGALVGVLDTAAGTFRFARAGYGTPVLARRLGDTSTLSAPQNALLGLAPQVSFAEASADVPTQSTLVLASPGFGDGDGAPEVVGAIAAATDLAADVVVNALMSMAASAAAHDDDAEGRDRSCVVLRYLHNAG